MYIKKISELLIGTNNRGKLREIRELMPKHIKTRAVLNFRVNSPLENGSSFDERIQSVSESYPEFECVQCLCDAMKLSASGKHGRSNEKNVSSQSAKVSS